MKTVAKFHESGLNETRRNSRLDATLMNSHYKLLKRPRNITAGSNYKVVLPVTLSFIFETIFGETTVIFPNTILSILTVERQLGSPVTALDNFWLHFI